MQDDIVILYTTDCPKCIVLKEKLEAGEITFTVNKDRKEMMALGMMSAPFLKINEDIMDFKTACEWINNRSSEEGSDID